jgi:HlyD family secretion protein
MSATVDIQTKEAKGIITVPIQSVTTRTDSSAFIAKDMKVEEEEEGEQGIVVNNTNNDDKKDLKDVLKVEECVFIYNDGKAKKVKVKTGIQDNNYIEIIVGVKEGDEVISGPYSAIAKQLKEGAEVKKVDKAELFSGTKK